MELDFSKQPSSEPNNQPAQPNQPNLPGSPPQPSPGAEIPIASVSNGNTPTQPSAPPTASDGRMEEIMSEQVTTKSADGIAMPTAPSAEKEKPKGSKLTLILAITFVVLLLGGGAYFVFATDYGKNLLGIGTAPNQTPKPEAESIADNTNLTKEEKTPGAETDQSEVIEEDSTDQISPSPTPNQPADTKGQNDQTRKTHLLQIQTAIESYKSSNGQYPISKTYSKLTDSFSEIYSLLVKDYLTEMPQDPKASEKWWYGYKSVDGENYAITARLENTQDSSGAMDGDVFLYFLTN